MSRLPRLEFSGALYHVIARGNEQRDVFRDDRDRELYLKKLAHYRSRFRFQLYAYCLMTNHVHLAIEVGPVRLSRIMLALHGSYAQAFNQRHQRVGHLFQGRYKALLVQKSSYLLALVRYIHDNPVKAGIASEPQLYRWSSDRFYRGQRAPDWLDRRGLLELLGCDRGHWPRRYEAFMGSEPPQPYPEIRPVAQVVKGDDGFARAAFDRAGECLPYRTCTVAQIVRAVAQLTGLDEEDLRGRAISRERARARAMVGHVARQHAHIPLTRVAEFLHRDPTTLVKDLRKLETELDGSSEVRWQLAAVIRELGLTS
jgi:REP element-mobilizing transposase RayT